MGKRGWQGVVLKAFGAQDHWLEVTGTGNPSPEFIRVHFQSDTLFDQVEAVPTAWLRFWLPDPQGSNVEYQRAYTIFDADPELGTFSVDFLIHEPAGPGSQWAKQAAVGERIAAMSLGSSKFTVPDPAPVGYLLIGDAASVPALRTIVESLPDETQIHLFLEQREPQEPRTAFPDHPGMTVTWVPRKDPDSLTNAVAGKPWDGWYAWAATESASLKSLRRYLRGSFGFDKTNCYFQAYWIEGRAMGKSRS